MAIISRAPALDRIERLWDILFPDGSRQKKGWKSAAHYTIYISLDGSLFLIERI